MTLGKLDQEMILNALRTVQDPELHRDLVSLNMIKDLKVTGSKVYFKVILTTPACPLKSKIEKDARQAVMNVPGVEEAEIEMGAKVNADGRDRNQFNLQIKNAVAVASGKGGVGKSTVAVNVAVALAQSGAAVGLLDADIYGPNVPTMMGVTSLPAQVGQKLIPAEAYGVKLMSIGFLVNKNDPLIWRGPMLHSAIQQFLRDVEWGDLDYLIIDLPPGTGDAQLSLSQSIPLSGGVIVTLPQQVSLEDARRGLEMFRKLNVPILGVVENMSYLELPDGSRVDVFGMGGGAMLAEAAEVPFIGEIPMDPSVRTSGDQGTPIVVSDPDAPSAKALRKVAESVAARLSVENFSLASTPKIKFVD